MNNSINKKENATVAATPKKKKALWGWGIAIFYSLFVLTFIGILFYSKTVNVDLVDENYYEKDIAYQGTIDRMTNSRALDKDISLKQVGSNIELTFPEIATTEEIGGAIRVLRPSEKDLDILMAVEPESDYKMRIPKENMRKGKWVVEIEWQAKDTLYYFEKSLMVY